MCDELIGMKHMLKTCKDSRMPPERIFVCVDNARPEDIDAIRTHWNDNNIKFIETKHNCKYPVNNFYKSAESAVGLAKEHGATEEDVIYVSPIDCIPNKGFYGEINRCTKNIIRQYKHKWQASVGYFFHPARNRPTKYVQKGAPFHETLQYHKREPKDFEEWYSKEVNNYLYKGHVHKGSNWSDILYAPVIQPIKRWNELGGVCGGKFEDHSKTSWDGEYIKLGLKDGAIFSFLGVGVFHHDLKPELQKQRGWK